MPERVDQPGSWHSDGLGWPAVEDLVTVCRWIGVEVDAASARFVEQMQAPGQYASLVLAVAPGRLAQIEFVLAVEDDLPLRMHEYRSWFLRTQPGSSLTQHVVVLGAGVLAEVHGDTEHWFRLRVTHLRDCDPEGLLGSPSLAPLAPLARAATATHRAKLLRDALGVIHRHEADPGRRAALSDCTRWLARTVRTTP